MGRKHIILLHGALGSKKELESVGNLLAVDFNVHYLDFNGHGDNFDDGNFYIDGFSADLNQFINSSNLESPIVFGFSMGGYVALYHEIQFPGHLEMIITLGTKFDWNPLTSEKEASFLDPEKIRVNVPKYAEYLNSIHSVDWMKNVEKTKQLMLRLGVQPLLNESTLSQIKIPVIVARGSQDKMVTDEESVWTVKQLNKGKYIELEDMKHPINQIDPERIVALITNSYEHVL